MARALTDMELRVLREVAGEMPPSPWGAAVSVTLETLADAGLITSAVGGRLTDSGRALLDRKRPAFDPAMYRAQMEAAGMSPDLVEDHVRAALEGDRRDG